jgi:flagellar biosynthesis/type III secretory pathway protein FliH
VSDIRPFLSVVASSVKSLGAVLPAATQPDAITPWTPKAQATPIDVEAERAAAREAARAEGDRETAALRGKLTALVGALETARRELAQPEIPELIADASLSVVRTWLGATPHEALFAPIVRAWLAKATEPATAHVHPDDVEALRAAIGEGAINVVGDPALAPGDIRIRGGALELAQRWDSRLAELRTAIIEAYEDKP